MSDAPLEFFGFRFRRYVIQCRPGSAQQINLQDVGVKASAYRMLELPGKHPLKDAHAALDAAALAAFGFSPKADLLKQLLDLNYAVAAKEQSGEPVTAPGVPASYGDPTALTADDCIRPLGANPVPSV